MHARGRLVHAHTHTPAHTHTRTQGEEEGADAGMDEREERSSGNSERSEVLRCLSPSQVGLLRMQQAQHRQQGAAVGGVPGSGQGGRGASPGVGAMEQLAEEDCYIPETPDAEIIPETPEDDVMIP